jgi:hypothetical protein
MGTWRWVYGSVREQQLRGRERWRRLGLVDNHARVEMTGGNIDVDLELA